jgi:hypothetical protein
MASFRVSPGIDIREVDLTLGIANIDTSIGALAGDFKWGPVLEPLVITSEEDLIKVHGRPTNDNFQTFYSAETFLRYSNNLRVIRTAQSGAVNAVAGATDSPNVLTIKNEDHYTSMTFESTQGYFAARYPGEYGNSLRIAYCPPDQFTFDHWVGSDGVDYRRYFPGPPSTSDYCAARNIANDEFHIIVIDENGRFTGTPGTVLETFAYVSLATDAVGVSGQTSYFVNRITNESKYIWWINNDPWMTSSRAGRSTDWVKGNTSQVNGQYVYFDADSAGSPIAAVEYDLVLGDDGSAAGLSELTEAYDIFGNAEAIDVNIIIGGASPNDREQAISYCSHLINIAETRHDCIACVSPPVYGTYGTSNSTDHTDAVVFTQFLPSSSFGVIDSAAIKKYDKYNGVYRWMPANPSVAGLCAKTDDIAFPWYSPAGFNRGQIFDVAKLSYNPNEAQRDELYKNRVNPIVQFPGEGTILFGDKTLLARPSAFDRINVRRLFNVLEKSIATAAKYMLFEFNDEFTRARFVNLVEPYLRTVQGNRGIVDFRVICDETNNTPDVIDSNNFIADIYIKPNRVINFIQLTFIATPSGVDFSEVIGQF